MQSKRVDERRAGKNFDFINPKKIEYQIDELGGTETTFDFLVSRDECNGISRQ